MGLVTHTLEEASLFFIYVYTLAFSRYTHIRATDDSALQITISDGQAYTFLVNRGV